MSETSCTIYRSLVHGRKLSLMSFYVGELYIDWLLCPMLWYVLIIIEVFWISQVYTGVYTGCCYVRGLGCIMVLATILSVDLYFSFMLNFVGWLSVSFLYAF
ncbi:hypothetical protein AMTRI_Chr08g167220 [Amborella trichopoda]